MVNKNDIKKKEDAIQNSMLYNGRKLTPSEKSIFDHDSIKNDLTKIRDTAEILEKVIKAKEEGVKNDTLLKELKGFKTSHPDSVKAINEKNGNQFEVAFTLLNGLSTPSGNESELEAQIEQIDDQIKALQTKNAKHNAKIKEIKRSSVEALRKEEAAAKKKNDLGVIFRGRLVGLEVDANGNFTNNLNTTVYTSNLPGNPHVNQRLVKVINLYKGLETGEAPMFDADIRYATPHRNYITGAQIENICFQLFDMIREGGDDFKNSLFSYIDNTSFTAINGNSITTKQDLKDAYTELLSNDWGSKSYEDIGKVYWEHLNKDNEAKYKPFEGDNAVSKWPSSFAANAPDNEKAIYPFRHFDINKVIDFMECVFPNSSLNNNPLLDISSTNHLPTNFLNKTDRVLEIRAFTKSLKPDTSKFPQEQYQLLDPVGWIKRNRPDQLPYLALTKTGQMDFKGILQYVWDAGMKDAAKRDNAGATNWSKRCTDNNFSPEVERKVLEQLILWIKEVKENAKNHDNFDIDERILEKITHETVKEFERLSQEKLKKEPDNDGVEFLISREPLDLSSSKLDGSITTVALPTATGTNNTRVWKRYLSLDALDEAVHELEIEELEYRVEKDSYEAELKSIFGRKADNNIEINDLEGEKKSLQEALAILKTKDLPEAQRKFMDVYKSGPPSTKYLRGSIFGMLYSLEHIGNLWKQKDPRPADLDGGTNLDPTYKGYYDKIKKLNDELIPHESWIGAYEASGADGKERASKMSEQQLKEVENAFKAANDLRLLTATEQKRWEDAKKGKSIAGDDSPTPSDLTPEILTRLFGFTVDETLKGSWTKVDGKTLKESDLNTIFLDEYGKGKTKFEGLMSHLVERGDIDNDKTYETGDDTKKNASWEKLLKKGPEKTIKTIIVHENEDALKTDSPDEAKKAELIKKMREDSATGYNKDDDEQNFFNKDRYGNPTEGSEDVSRDQLITYLFDKKIENVKKASEAWGKSENDNNNGKETGVLAHLKANWHWYALGTLGIVILLAVIFWKNISEWWNGPAEEEGKGAEDNEKEEEENE